MSPSDLKAALEKLGDLKEAADILEQYAKPYDTMIDNGNLYFAGTEYQKVCDALIPIVVELTSALLGVMSTEDTFGERVVFTKHEHQAFIRGHEAFTALKERLGI